MGGDNFRKGEGKVDPNNKFLKLREEFYEQERLKKEQLWSEVTRQLNKIDALFGCIDIEISNQLENNTEFEETVQNLISELTKSSYECYLVPASSSGSTTTTIRVSWDWNLYYNKLSSPPDFTMDDNERLADWMGLSGLFRTTVVRYCILRKKIVDSLETELTNSIVSNIQETRNRSTTGETFMKGNGRTNFTNRQLKFLKYTPPGPYEGTNFFAITPRSIDDRGRFRRPSESDILDHVLLGHIPSNTSWRIDLDEKSAMNVVCDGLDLFFVRDQNLYVANIEDRIEKNKPIDIRPINLDDTIKLNMRDGDFRRRLGVIKNPHGEQIIVGFGHRDIIYFNDRNSKGVRDSAFFSSFNWSQVVFDSDGKTMWVERVEDKFWPYSMNKDGIEVMESHDASDDGLDWDSIEERVQDRGLNSYSGDKEVEGILNKIREELQVAGINVSFGKNGDISLSWSW